MLIHTLDGTAAKPAQAFVNDPDSGRRLASAGDVRDVVGGVDVEQYTPTLVKDLVARDASAGLKVGSGAAVAKILKGTTTWVPGLISANDSVNKDVTVTGAAAGDPVIVGGNLDTGATKVNVTGSVTAPNTVTLCASCNNGVNSITIAATVTLTILVVQMA